MSIWRPSSSAFIRASSIVSLLYCLGHHSGSPWTPVSGARPESVVALMHEVFFETMGVTRSYWEFYYGFGLIISAFLAMQAVALWFVARVARRDAALALPLSATFLAGSVVNAVLSYRYFFALPALFSVVISMLLGASICVALLSSRARVEHGPARGHAHGT